MTLINACNSCVTPNILRLAFIEFEKQRSEQPSSVKTHPAQKVMLENIGFPEYPIPSLIDNEELLIYVPKLTIANIPVKLSTLIPPYEIHLIDSRDETLVRITSLALPAGFTENSITF